ncbi:probable receptor-like protein kinase At5g20050 [Selaginella moellendorffii]|nr:probable receptor-like protein kinase At5g20050 [Selaginella moellendorffii]|eukprot:XP_024515302.1 probable receptor-like protein kinase At5g20050 [Selaginella moellendorffii]
MMICDPYGQCNSDPSNTHISVCPVAPGCNPAQSFVYTAPTIDEDHCATNTTYYLYDCSPPVSRRRPNPAILYYIELDNGSRCEEKKYQPSDLVASMATGWYNYQRPGGACGRNVTITALNGRTVTAMVVDECTAMAGCTAATSFYPPCSPKSLGATQGVWEALGYKISEGIIDITWEFERAGKRPRLKRTVAIASSVAAATAGIVLGFVLGVFAWRAARSRARDCEKESELGGMLPERFRHRKLCAATGDFGVGSKLGQGGSGSVFKGVLPDGRLVAVKRIGGSGKQFRAEVMAVGRIHHLNLVRLLGFCIKSPLHFLVYEFMPNGSLDSWIFGKGRYLDWSSRVSIAMDVARGLAYLHDSCREKIFHLDIKPQNILLDGKMRAKISDFGFAKIVDKDKSQTITVMRGTQGYMAPEWLHSTITDKTDVYSYGVVLIELVCCRRRMEELDQAIEGGEEETNYLAGVEDVEIQADCHNSLIDPRLRSDPSFVEVECQKILEIAVSCTQEEPWLRPSMGQVVKQLETLAELETTTLPRGFSVNLPTSPIQAR